MNIGRAYAFATDHHLRPWSRLFLVHPEACVVHLDAQRLTIRFGRWSLTTPIANLATVDITGPYTWWKVAGPAHLSPSDRGVTFATTSRAGVCIAFHEPVASIEPFGALRHPNVTVTVADPPRFATDVRSAIASRGPTHEVDDPYRARQGTYRAAVHGVRRWSRRTDSIRHTQRGVDHIEPPARLAPAADLQRFEDGTGPAYHRRYRIRIDHPDHDAAATMAILHADFNALANQQLGPITKVDGAFGSMRPGDRYVVALAGAWSGPVQVLDVDEQRFRFVTLDGHLEAGIIDFSTADTATGITFTIESWATSGGPFSRFLYDVVGVARALQAEMWVEACETVTTLAAGVQTGPVEVITEREGINRA